MIFTLEKAIEYIKSKIADFYSSGRRLLDQREEASRLVQVLSPVFQESEARELENQINRKLNNWQSIEKIVRPFADYWGVSRQGLGAIPLIPIVLLTAAISVAIALWNWFSEPSDYRMALDLIAREKLTPQQAAEIGASTSMFAGINQTLLLTILGIGGLLFLTARR